MDSRKFFDKYFRLGRFEGESKVMPLDEAVRNYVKPGMHLHLAYLPFAVTHEIVRQFKGQKPNFTVSCLGGVENIIILAICGLVKRLITSYAGLILPSPVMSRGLQNAIDNGLEIENWSLLTIIQRLMAAAFRMPFIPTCSLEGTCIAKENIERQLFKKIADPFEGGEVGIIKPLSPDITIMHAYCADPSGNAIPVLPHVEEAYGAFASKEGVILSVEKIVSTAYLRKHSLCVKVPANIVKCVIEAPFGMHPYGCRGHDGGGYGEDIEFAKELQSALRQSETAEKWVREWIIDVGSHENYLRKLGFERLQMLQKRVSYRSWKIDSPKIVEKISKDAANNVERAVIFAAREIINSIKRHKYDTLLAGIGISHLASWIATYMLNEKGESVNLLIELGLYGFRPPPGQPFLASVRGMESCPMLTDTVGVLGLIANKTKMLACMSAGQVDKRGNVNSTRIGNLFLFGSGGANDVSTTAKEVIITLLHDRRRLVDEVPYVTFTGLNVRKVVTDRAVFEKIKDELVLSKVYVRENESIDDTLAFARENTGWNLRVSDKLLLLEEPGLDELLLLRCFDPERYFLGKI